MDKNEVVKLKAKLPHNYIKLLTEKTGKSESLVYKTFAPNSPLINNEIVDAAIVLIEDRKKQDQLRKQRIENI